MRVTAPSDKREERQVASGLVYKRRELGEKQLKENREWVIREENGQ